MRKIKLWVPLFMVTLMPFSLVHSEEVFSPICIFSNPEFIKWKAPNNYDQILELLDEIESDDFEKKYSQEDLENITEYLIFLSREGLLPGEFEEAIELEEDIQELLQDKELYEPTGFSKNPQGYLVESGVFLLNSSFSITNCGFAKGWKKTKKFCKKHKKAIIIGAVIVVAVAAVTVAVVVATSTSAASAAGGATGAVGAAVSDSGSTKSESSGRLSSNSSTSQTSSNTAPTFQAVMEDQVTSFKDHLADESFFSSPEAGRGLSVEETGRVSGVLFAHDSFNYFNSQIPNYPQLSEELRSISSHPSFTLPLGAINNPVGFGHHEIDSKFSSNCGATFSDPSKEVNIDALSYQIRGETARYYGYYGQAVNDFSKAISMNPTDPMPYLQRSVSYFDMGQYNESFEDFRKFTTQIEKVPEKIPFSTPEFTLGFAKGLPKGIYESGKGVMLFLGDLITHPIHTSTQMYEALSTLASLARNDEWGVIGEVLSPEIHQLITQWDTLPSDERGELAGYAFGKHGADIVVPGAAAKIASKSVKSARELVTILKNLQIAEETIVLETAAGIGNTARAGEILNAGKTSAFLGEELGFTAKEMGQLQKTGKLEGAINSLLDRLVSQSESEVFKAAISKDSHVKMVRDYLSKPAKEVQKGIKSYEKQIALHQEKIANPSKFIPHWDKLHPERQQALINKKWPAEIQCYTEQRNILQSILNERIK